MINARHERPRRVFKTQHQLSWHKTEDFSTSAVALVATKLQSRLVDLERESQSSVVLVDKNILILFSEFSKLLRLANLSEHLFKLISMQLSERFLNLVKQQLNSFEAEPCLKQIVVYIAQTRDGQNPSLEAVGEWPNNGKGLPPVEADLELRAPSPDRRWYPLQDGSILLGVLRAERLRSDQAWPEGLDLRLQATSAAIAECLCLDRDRMKLLDQLSEQREQIGVMVHQLRNPLAALGTYAKLLLRRLGPESKHLSLVEGLLSEQAQLNRYVSALDQLSQFKLPSPAGTTAPLLLPPVLSNSSSLNIRSLLEPLIERSSVTANLQSRQWFAPSNWPIWTEKEIPLGDGIVAEIVANLLENAFRYSSPCSSIGLKLSEQGLCVWDEGTPIAQEERERIFEKGYRGKASDQLSSSGSGFGLALALQLAEKLGGDLSLIKKPKDFDQSLPDKGNAFVLTLPLKEEQR